MHMKKPMEASMEAQLTQMLERYQAKELQTSALIVWARALPQTVILNWPAEKLDLQKAYIDLWFELLDRLESSALFTEESCSFSQADLLTTMHKWVKKVARITQS